MFPADTLSDTRTRSIPADRDTTRQPSEAVISPWGRGPLIIILSHLSTETSVAAATLVVTVLAPGPPRTAQLPAAQPTVARVAVTGEGGRAGPVVSTVRTQRDPTTRVRLEPLATTLHYGLGLRAEYH